GRTGGRFPRMAARHTRREGLFQPGPPLPLSPLSAVAHCLLSAPPSHEYDRRYLCVQHGLAIGRGCLITLLACMNAEPAVTPEYGLWAESGREGGFRRLPGVEMRLPRLHGL